MRIFPESMIWRIWQESCAAIQKSLMKYLAIILLFIPVLLKAQKVFSVNYESQADVKLFVTQYESQADLLVFVEEYESRANGNEGRWFFESYESRADKKVFFVEYESQADLKIFFVQYESRAGWRNREKMHLMFRQD